MQDKKRNPLDIPHGGWFPAGHQLMGMARPTVGTAAALIELYRGRSGGRDAETGVIWNRSEKFMHISSDRGSDIVAILKRSGDESILAFRPPECEGDCLHLYVKMSGSRRAWCVVKASKSTATADEDADDVEGDEASDEVSQDDSD